MSAQPAHLSEQPAATAIREGLRCLQFSGAIFLRAHFSAPWAYESPESDQITGMLRPGSRRVILFHIFTEGRCRLALHRGGEAEIAAGDIAIFPFADQHRLGDPDVEGAVAVLELMPPPPWTSMPIIHHGGGGTPASMVCGYLYCDDLPFNPVLASLPPFMKIRPTSEPLARWVDASIQYALASGGPGTDNDPLLQRLPELLFTECLCEFARQRGEEPGWLAALADPIVGRALACLHREPAYPWTLESLARRAASSRSVLDERFRSLLGRAPMSYLTAWRLQLASQQLRTTRAGLAEIAQATGYASEASLSRAFKREVGMSPGQWRQAAQRGDA